MFERALQVVSETGDTAWHIAVEGGHTEVLAALLASQQKALHTPSSSPPRPRGSPSNLAAAAAAAGQAATSVVASAGTGAAESVDPVTAGTIAASSGIESLNHAGVSPLDMAYVMVWAKGPGAESAGAPGAGAASAGPALATSASSQGRASHSGAAAAGWLASQPAVAVTKDAAAAVALLLTESGGCDAGRVLPDEDAVPVALRGSPALHVAILGNNTDLVKALLRAKPKAADPSASDAGGVAAVQLATKLGQTRSVELLVAAGADTTVADAATGDTPLHLAAAAANQELARALLPVGSSVLTKALTLTNKAGLTAFEVGLACMWKELRHTTRRVCRPQPAKHMHLR